MKTEVTVKDFIEQYLVKEIADIKDEHPYLAFELIAVGIEFLGRCINNRKPEDQKCSAADFNLALMCMDPQGKYRQMNLYKKLRCGLVHSMMVGKLITLSDGSDPSAENLNIDEFYSDFKDLCLKVADSKPITMTLNVNAQAVSAPFLRVTEKQTSSGMVSVTGNTQSK